MTRKVPLYILCLISAINSYAQKPVAFGYDASGNRISRTGTSVKANRAKGIYQKNTHSTDNKTNINTLSYDETSSIITASLDKSQAGSEASLSIFNLSGGLVYSCKMQKGKSAVDTSSFPSGIYVAAIETGQKKQTIKFTKK